MRAEQYYTLVATESYELDGHNLIARDSWSSFRGSSENFMNLRDGGWANGDGNDGENNKGPDDGEEEDTERVNAKMKSGAYVAWVLDDEVNKIIAGMGEFGAATSAQDIILHGPPTRETSTYLQPCMVSGTDVPVMKNVTTITMTQTLVQVVAAN